MDLGNNNNNNNAVPNENPIQNNNTSEGANVQNMFNPNDLVFGNQPDGTNQTQPRFGDIAEFLFDPFWQSQMRQMASGNTDNGLLAGTTGFTGMGMPDPSSNSGPMFGDAQASDLFGG